MTRAPRSSCASGTDSEMSSGLSREQTQIVKDAPGLTRGADGPVASAELFVIVNHPKRSTGTDANVPLRGVESGAFAVRPRLQARRGPTLRAGPQRDHRRPGRRRPVRRARGRQRRPLGRERVEGRRHLRGRRRHLRIGALVRREGAAGGVQTRRLVPVRVRAARARGLAGGVQGRHWPPIRGST